MYFRVMPCDPGVRLVGGSYGSGTVNLASSERFLEKVGSAIRRPFVKAVDAVEAAADRMARASRRAVRVGGEHVLPSLMVRAARQAGRRKELRGTAVVGALMDAAKALREEHAYRLLREYAKRNVGIFDPRYLPPLGSNPRPGEVLRRKVYRDIIREGVDTGKRGLLRRAIKQSLGLGEDAEGAKGWYHFYRQARRILKGGPVGQVLIGVNQISPRLADALERLSPHTSVGGELVGDVVSKLYRRYRRGKRLGLTPASVIDVKKSNRVRRTAGRILHNLQRSELARRLSKYRNVSFHYPGRALVM